MRARILLGFIICLIFGFTDFAAHAVEATKPVSVRATIDKSIVDVTAKIKTSDLKAIWKDLAKVEADAKELRKKEKRQSEIDEIHLDSLLSSLEDVPREKKFAKKDCPAYKSKIQAEYSPEPREDGTHPEFVKMTLAVLEALCAK